jgi:hypothetical protein
MSIFNFVLDWCALVKRNNHGTWSTAQTVVTQAKCPMGHELGQHDGFFVGEVARDRDAEEPRSRRKEGKQGRSRGIVTVSLHDRTER